jgi:hypothetical protein
LKFRVIRKVEIKDDTTTYTSTDILKSFDNANDAYAYLDECYKRNPNFEYFVDRF